MTPKRPLITSILAVLMAAPGLAAHSTASGERARQHITPDASEAPESSPAQPTVRGKGPDWVDPLSALRARHGSVENWRTALGLQPLAAVSRLILHSVFKYRTLTFGVRLHGREDYADQRPVELEVTLDDGLQEPLDELADHAIPEPSLSVRLIGGVPAVLARERRLPRRWSARTGQPLRPSEDPGPDVLIGTLDADGWLLPAARLPSSLAGFRYAFDPFSGGMVRIGAGGLLGPARSPSARVRRIPASALVIRDASGRLLPGARIRVVHLASEPGPVPVVEFNGMRMVLGEVRPADRAVFASLARMPGEVGGRDRISFPMLVFHPTRASVEGNGLRLNFSVPVSSAD